MECSVVEATSATAVPCECVRFDASMHACPQLVWSVRSMMLHSAPVLVAASWTAVFYMLATASYIV
jgi:hypothetical protein